MKLRQARKILRRPRRARYATAMAAIRRLEKRSRRWHRLPRDVDNRRPTYTLRDLFRLADMEPGGWNDHTANAYVRQFGDSR